MTTPTDITFVANTTPAISAAWLNGQNDWVNGAYGILGSTYTATAFRAALGIVSGSYTTASLGIGVTDERSIAHGLGTDNIDFDFSMVGSDAVHSWDLRGGITASDGRLPAWNDGGTGGITLSGILPAAGNIRIAVKNNSPSVSQTITVYWWARAR